MFVDTRKAGLTLDVDIYSPADAVSHERHSTGSWIHDLAIVNAVKYNPATKVREAEWSTHFAGTVGFAL